VVFKVSRMPDKIPDFLRERAGRYFEREGLCFAPVFEVHSATGMMCIYFQNRHAREAVAFIEMRPAIRSFRVTRPPVPSILVSVDCPGAAFGVARIAFPISREFQGKKLNFEIAADVTYPARRGKLLRHRAGMRVGSTSDLSQGIRLLKALGGLVFFGLVHETHPAKVAMMLPRGVAESIPPPQPPRVEILWRPAPAENGAGALSPRAAA
jgi:hypothetical protein